MSAKGQQRKSGRANQINRSAAAIDSEDDLKEAATEAALVTRCAKFLGWNESNLL